MKKMNFDACGVEAMSQDEMQTANGGTFLEGIGLLVLVLGLIGAGVCYCINK